MLKTRKYCDRKQRTHKKLNIYNMLMFQKTQYCYDTGPSKMDLPIKCNANQNSRRLFSYRNWQADSAIFILMQNT